MSDLRILTNEQLRLSYIEAGRVGKTREQVLIRAELVSRGYSAGNSSLQAPVAMFLAGR